MYMYMQVNSLITGKRAVMQMSFDRCLQPQATKRNRPPFGLQYYNVQQGDGHSELYVISSVYVYISAGHHRADVSRTAQDRKKTKCM